MTHSCRTTSCSEKEERGRGRDSRGATATTTEKEGEEEGEEREKKKKGGCNTTARTNSAKMFSGTGAQILAEARKARIGDISSPINASLDTSPNNHPSESNTSSSTGQVASSSASKEHHDKKKAGGGKKEKKKKKSQSKEELFILAPDPTTFAKVTNEVDERKYKQDLISTSDASLGSGHHGNNPLASASIGHHNVGAGQAAIEAMDPSKNKQDKTTKALIKGVSYFEYVSPCFQEAAERINLIMEEGGSNNGRSGGIWSAGMSMSALRTMSRKTLLNPESEDRKICALGAECTNTDPSHFLMYRYCIFYYSYIITNRLTSIIVS